MEFFVNIEELGLNNRLEFESLFKCCSKELDLPLDNMIPQFIYQVGNNAGVIAYDIYGNAIGYTLYNKQDNQHVNFTHFWVAPQFRRNKVATRMISKVIIIEQPCVMSAYVNDSLVSAQMLLKFLRFKCIRIVKYKEYNKYYFVTQDDGNVNRFTVLSQ